MRTLFLSLAIALVPLIAAAQQQESSIRTDPGADYFTRARQLYDAATQSADATEKKRLYQHAIPMLEDYVRNYPRHLHTQAAQYFLAESYYALGRKRQSNMLYDQIIQRYRTGEYVAAAAYRLAYENYNIKNYKRAARLFGLTASNAAKPQDRLRSTYFRAQCYLLLNEPKRAHPLLQKVASSTVDSPYKSQAKIASAHILLNQKKYAEALPLYQALDLPDMSQAFIAETKYHAGVCATALDKHDLAKEYFAAVLKTPDSPWRATSHIALLGLHYKDKDYAQIIKQISRTRVLLTPEQRAKQNVIVGQSHFQKKNYSKAIEAFLDVERAQPGSDPAFEAGYYKLLSLYNINGQRIPMMVDQFLQNYAVGRGTSKYIHLALLMKAESLYSIGDYKGAAKAYTSIGNQFIDKKNLPSLLYKKAWCLSEIGNHEVAADNFSQFIEAAPKDERINNAHAKRAQSYMQLGHRIKALRDFDTVIKAAPKSQIAAMSLQLSARLQRDAKNHEDVIDRLETLLKNHPTLDAKAKANSNYWLGSSHFKLDQFRKAIPYLETAQKMNSSAYGKQTSMLLILARYSLKDVDGLKDAIRQAEKTGLTEQIPLPVYRWIGSQYYTAGEYKRAATYLTKGCEKGVPRKTPSIIWRLLSKSQLKSAQYAPALVSVDNLISMETEDARRVPALLDKTNILIGLKKYDEAKATGKEALEFRPAGQTKAGLLLALGDANYFTSDYPAASEHYVLVVEAFEDHAVHEEALYKLIQALKKSNKTTEAANYETLLKKEYPENKPPAGF